MPQNGRIPGRVGSRRPSTAHRLTAGSNHLQESNHTAPLTQEGRCATELRLHHGLDKRPPGTGNELQGFAHSHSLYARLLRFLQQRGSPQSDTGTEMPRTSVAHLLPRAHEGDDPRRAEPHTLATSGRQRVFRCNRVEWR